MRSPSPTFITIESIRRTDSPQRVTPSPTLFHRPPTPPTPPPRRCETPTSRLNRITPSPTFDKAENLPRLKDTTAKLSRGVTPPPLLTHQIAERKSEIVESPPTFHRQIKIESQVTCIPLGQDDPDLDKKKREFFEEAQRAETNKVYVRKEPIAIPERLGSDTEECEMELKNKEKEEHESAPLAESLQNHTESPKCDKEKVNSFEQEMPTFDIQAIKNIFKLGEPSSSFKEEETDQEELVSTLSQAKADTSEPESPQETNGGPRQISLIPLQENDLESVPAEPSAFSETKSSTEHFSNVDEFGIKVAERMTAVTEHSEKSVSSQQQVPFSYADAVKRKTAAVRRTETYDEDSTEKLLRNFHKTWLESETVFKSLGYTVSEESTSQIAHQTNIVSSEKQTNKYILVNVLPSLQR
uniref:Uncharacterized protein n=1 Tax=Gouania willdenowi TaxID=441366 RepID=A0A8C5I7A9_GOUWI